jgi:hypothetical protein
MSKRKVYEWMGRFKGGQRSVYNSLSGRLSTGTGVEIKGQIDQCIRDNQKVGIYEIASEKNISH